MATAHLWWQHGVIYQVYPRSFRDSDGDGIGDLPGITARLDYLRDLGVDALWLSPIYPSPMADFGYDISDHAAIDPRFGTLADFDRLLAEAHARGLRVILDYVPNHTSDAHPWFVASRSSRDDPRRDWFIWRDPARGPSGQAGPPNNWLAAFGGSAWEYDAATGQYYLHMFHRSQPDLNWRNPAVREAMLDVLRFWLDRGVDGFRIDALQHVMKDARFRDNPPNPAYRPGHDPAMHAQVRAYNDDQPENHDLIALLRAVTDGYDERVLIGEIYLPLERLIAYYRAGAAGVHLPYNFQLIVLPWEARPLAAAIDAYETALPAASWPNWVLGNHDNPRIASRAGAAQARVAAMLLLTLRGTPTLYYGDELGMRDVPIPPALVRDPQGLNQPALGRDPARTPLAWDATAHGGFTTGDPWLPLHDDYLQVNVATEGRDPASLLTLHRRLLALRRATPALAIGRFAPVAADGDLIVYLRETGDNRFLVALNLGHDPQVVRAAALAPGGHIILSTQLDRDGEIVGPTIALRADEGVIVALPTAH